METAFQHSSFKRISVSVSLLVLDRMQYFIYWRSAPSPPDTHQCVCEHTSNSNCVLISPQIKPSSHMMANIKECDQMTVEDSDEPGYWEQPGMVADRDNINGLIDISEENFWKDQERSAHHCPTGWEEAVQGWGSVPPAACTLQPQRKGKKPKNGEPDPHCLLCVNMRLPDFDSSTVAPDYHCEPHTQPHDTGLHNNTPSRLLSTSYSHTTESALAKQAPDCLVLNDLQKATQHLLLGESMVAERKPRESLQPHHLPSKYRLLRSRPSNILLSINSFTVLPPVHPPQHRPQKIAGQICYGEPGSEHSGTSGETLESNADNITTSREATGDERGEVTRVDDTYSAAFNSKYCPCQQNHHLLSTFSVCVPERYEVSLTSIADTAPHSSYSTGRYLKQAPRGNSRRAKQIAATPQLPILLGTKVHMRASAHRLL